MGPCPVRSGRFYSIFPVIDWKHMVFEYGSGTGESFEKKRMNGVYVHQWTMICSVILRILPNEWCVCM